MIHYSLENLLPVDINGYYGNFGGAYVPESLKRNIAELASAYRRLVIDPSFMANFDRLMHEYVGRPTPLYRVDGLSRRYGAEVYLEDQERIRETMRAWPAGKTHGETQDYCWNRTAWCGCR